MKSRIWNLDTIDLHVEGLRGRHPQVAVLFTLLLQLSRVLPVLFFDLLMFEHFFFKGYQFFEILDEFVVAHALAVQLIVRLQAVI